MSDDTLIADLVRAGLSPELVGRVSAALSGTVRDNVRDIVREYERTRKERQRRNAYKIDGKQTMSVTAPASKTAENVPDEIGSANLSSLPFEVVERGKERKKEEQARRGTRLQVGQPLAEEFRAAAIEEGFSEIRIPRLWLEFIDYWSALPGQRGLKLNWLSTWRNRLRSLKDRETNGNGHETIKDAGKRAWVEARANLKQYSNAPNDGDVREPALRLLSAAGNRES